MKPRNFPARKEYRGIMAEKRQEFGSGPWPLNELDEVRLDDARAVRTKKYRGSR